LLKPVVIPKSVEFSISMDKAPFVWDGAVVAAGVQSSGHGFEFARMRGICKVWLNFGNELSEIFAVIIREAGLRSAAFSGAVHDNLLAKTLCSVPEALGRLLANVFIDAAKVGFGGV
jgi:hypothetical protein